MRGRAAVGVHCEGQCTSSQRLHEASVRLDLLGWNKRGLRGEARTTYTLQSTAQRTLIIVHCLIVCIHDKTQENTMKFSGNYMLI